MPPLPNKEFKKLVPKLREKDFYKSQEPRRISWPEYNLNQIEDAYETLRFIDNEVNKTEYMILIGQNGRPLTDPKILAKAILICEALNFTERNAQGWIKIIGPCVGIKKELDDRTIGEAYGRPEVLFILKQVFDKTKTSDGILCGDGSGLETTRKQNYESHKSSKEYMTSIVDSREVVQSFDISGQHENKAMHSLIKSVEGNSLRLDAGFIDRSLVKEMKELGIKSYIFPKKNTLLDSQGNYAWTQMYLELLRDTMQWLKEYHKRSHSESFHSAFKRKYGIITKRNPIPQLNQVTARIILHNRSRIRYFSRLDK